MTTRKRGLIDESDFVPMQDHSMGPAGNMRQSGQAAPAWSPMDFIGMGAGGLVGAGGGAIAAFPYAGIASLLGRGRLAGAAVGTGAGIGAIGGAKVGLDAVNDYYLRQQINRPSYAPSVPPDLAGPAYDDGTMYGADDYRPRRVKPQGF